MLAEVRGLGEAALREATLRKTGLVVATVFILLLALALFLKIRDLNAERRVTDIDWNWRGIANSQGQRYTESCRSSTNQRSLREE